MSPRAPGLRKVLWASYDNKIPVGLLNLMSTTNHKISWENCVTGKKMLLVLDMGSMHFFAINSHFYVLSFPSPWVFCYVSYQMIRVHLQGMNSVSVKLLCISSFISSCWLSVTFSVQQQCKEEMHEIHPIRLEILLTIKIGIELRNPSEIICSFFFFSIFFLKLFNTGAGATFMYIY